MLGKALVNKFRIQIIPTDFPDLDITQSNATKKIIDLNPTIVLHLAAYTDVDKAELNPDRAWKVNSIGTKNVALACQKLEIPILYVSTAYIFDGEKCTPYVEWDSPNPISVYGATKLEGELWIKNLVSKYWILRTSGLYGDGGNNFVSAILKKAKKGQEIKVVADQIGSPTYTKDLALAILKLLKTTNFGTYHITNSDWTSWYEFAQAILEIKKIHCDVLPISSSELNRPAKRPKNSRLLNFMWERTFGKPLRHWKEALNEFLRFRRADL